MNTYQLTSQWRVGLGVNFRDEQTPICNPGWSVDNYATTDLMAEYKIKDRYAFKGNVSNSTNKLYADALHSGHYVPSAGHTMQLTLNAKL